MSPSRSPRSRRSSISDTSLRLGVVAGIVRAAILGWFRSAGWRVEGTLPATRKFVLMGAPHTSNWDFPVFVGTVEGAGLRPRFMGKDSLFRWPMGGFMRGLGGLPVDRSSSNDTVLQIAAVFAKHDEFALVIAAEGTRAPTTRWRTGYYRIAQAAGVPIVCAGPDYDRRVGIFGPHIVPTGDYEADMAPAWAFFRTLKPRHPERAMFPDGRGM
jgi:1-acyl-sn-glycerol-3-phosphate acyltransferase